MDTTTDTSVQITRVIPATRDEVFRAWTEPEQMRHWACPEGAEVLDVAADLTVGGSYHIRMRVADGGVYTAFGTYREIERPSRLVYTWDWREPDHAVGETRVSVRFRDLGESTEVELVHDLFPAAEAAEGHRQGWTSCLDRLEGLFSASS